MIWILEKAINPFLVPQPLFKSGTLIIYTVDFDLWALFCWFWSDVAGVFPSLPVFLFLFFLPMPWCPGAACPFLSSLFPWPATVASVWMKKKKVQRRKDRREGIAGGLRPHNNLGGRKPPTYRKKHPLPVKTTRFIDRISWIACAVTWLHRAS